VDVPQEVRFFQLELEVKLEVQIVAARRRKNDVRPFLFTLLPPPMSRQ
jgi:hypothetical protein